MDGSVDVLSGTSAGGINAAILGLANVQRFDLDGLRNCGSTKGRWAACPAARPTRRPSLLYGDQALLSGPAGGPAEAGRQGAGEPGRGPDPTRVFLTTTLLAGEASRFTDEYGTLVRESTITGCSASPVPS